MIGIARMILTALLLYGVYTETGVWTTLLLSLSVAAGEIKAYLEKKKQEAP